MIEYSNYFSQICDNDLSKINNLGHLSISSTPRCIDNEILERINLFKNYHSLSFNSIYDLEHVPKESICNIFHSRITSLHLDKCLSRQWLEYFWENVNLNIQNINNLYVDNINIVARNLTCLDFLTGIKFDKNLKKVVLDMEYNIFMEQQRRNPDWGLKYIFEKEDISNSSQKHSVFKLFDSLWDVEKFRVLKRVYIRMILRIQHTAVELAEELEDEYADFDIDFQAAYSNYSFDNASESGINLVRDYIWSNKDKIKQQKFEQFLLVIGFQVPYDVTGCEDDYSYDYLQFPFVLTIEDVGDITKHEWHERFAKLTQVLDDCIIYSKRDDQLLPQTSSVIEQRQVETYQRCDNWWLTNISNNWDV